ncbi:MAG: glycoside hydrolase family 38 N-terminal domain-containing protein, partial [Candidatus Geothermincolia bacterium]
MESEIEVRRRLRIPDDALRVIVFAESSHWDPDWLLTSDEYYRFRIRHILDRMIHELLKDPERVFSIESIFFLKMYWDRNPARREIIRDLSNAGRIRFSGTGFTQPDTMIPSTEAIIRDFQIGRQWLRDNGIEAEPHIAYMTDDFGLSPAFPSILASLGVKYAAGSRIDGHYFVGADLALPGGFPLRGSSAELLLKILKTTDIVWQAPDGSEVLFHLNLKDYNYGGMISMRGVARWMDIMAGVPAR